MQVCKDAVTQNNEKEKRKSENVHISPIGSLGAVMYALNCWQSVHRARYGVGARVPRFAQNVYTHSGSRLSAERFVRETNEGGPHYARRKSKLMIGANKMGVNERKRMECK